MDVKTSNMIRAFAYLGEHLTDCELSDFSDGSWGSLLELNTVESLVEIDGVVSGDGYDFLLLAFSNSWHFLAMLIIMNNRYNKPLLFK